MRITNLILLSLSIIFILNSCNLPEDYFTPKPNCNNQVAIFDNNPPISDTYQHKALAILANQKPSDFRYYFQTFLEVGNDTIMMTNFRNEQYCFDVKVVVNKWDKLAGMHRANGNSYPKELYDLEWQLIQRNGKTVILYQDMHDIID